MSLNSLTEVEVRQVKSRRAAVGQAENVGGGNNAPTRGDGNAPPPNNALSMLVKYIPTESVTLYVAAISAAAALKAVWPAVTAESIYWFFALLTPVLFALIFIGKLKAKNQWPLKSLAEWPWWKTFAATVAFLVWALAVPGNPYIKDATSGAVVGFFALFISTILSVLEQVFDRPTPGDA